MREGRPEERDKTKGEKLNERQGDMEGRKAISEVMENWRDKEGREGRERKLWM